MTLHHATLHAPGKTQCHVHLHAVKLGLVLVLPTLLMIMVPEEHIVQHTLDIRVYQSSRVVPEVWIYGLTYQPAVRASKAARGQQNEVSVLLRYGLTEGYNCTNKINPNT